MQTRTLSIALYSALGIALSALAPGAQANGGDSSDATSCKMDFTLSGWSAAYSTAQGSGTVRCSNGESMPVAISAKGGGLTVGAYKITDGHGTFSHIAGIHDVLGHYGMASAHAGVVGSAHAAALTKGKVSLALSGTGQGWDIGVGFSGFTIERAH